MLRTVGSRDVDQGGHGDHCLRVEVVQGLRGFFGDGQKVLTADEALPAAAAALEEVEERTEAVTEEAVLSSEGVLEIADGEVSCGAGAE